MQCLQKVHTGCIIQMAITMWLVYIVQTEGASSLAFFIYLSAFSFKHFIHAAAVTLGIQQCQDALGQRKSTAKERQCRDREREEEEGRKADRLLRVKWRMLILTVRRASFAWTAKRQKKEQQIKGKKKKKKKLGKWFCHCMDL